MLTVVTLNVAAVNMIRHALGVSDDRSYHHGDLRHALLQASAELIAEKGAEAFTLREVARRVGVSHTAPYRHFKDREALLDVLAAEGFAAHHEASHAAATAREDVLERLRATGKVYVQFAEERPSQFRMMFGRTSPDPGAAGLASFAELLARIDECQEAGVIAPHQRLRVAGVLWCAMHGLAELSVSGAIDLVAEGDREGLANFLMDTLVRGLRPHEPHERAPEERGRS